MRAAQKFAGYSLEEADNLRKACGKKIRSLIAAEREKFVEGCETTGYGSKLGTQLFDIIEPFADYAFNKSHAYGYGLIAYQTAWLKVHYPVEYLAALLTSVKDDKDRTAVYLGECRAQRIEVLVPDVNSSAAEFTPSTRCRTGGSRIVFGLGGRAQRRRGPRRAHRRRARGRTDLSPTSTTSAAVSTRSCSTSGQWSRSIKAGAFDSLGHPRKALCLVAEEIVDRTLERRREEEAGISTLFSLPRDGRCRDRSDGIRGARRRPGPDRGPGVRQGPAARLRKGDARPVRERPPLAGGRGGARDG